MLDHLATCACLGGCQADIRIQTFHYIVEEEEEEAGRPGRAAGRPAGRRIVGPAGPTAGRPASGPAGRPAGRAGPDFDGC